MAGAAMHREVFRIAVAARLVLPWFSTRKKAVSRAIPSCGRATRSS
ncbi:hypothetical protein [Poseidonocella sp. HB161398]|nr:hypothetical protein [Poseidonocella sp. HB161398]